MVDRVKRAANWLIQKSERLERDGKALVEMSDKFRLDAKEILENNGSRPNLHPDVFGFQIYSNSRGYFYATGRIAGWACNVYIGKNLDLAREKISQWVRKNRPTSFTEIIRDFPEQAVSTEDTEGK